MKSGMKNEGVDRISIKMVDDDDGDDMLAGQGVVASQVYRFFKPLLDKRSSETKKNMYDVQTVFRREIG